MEARQVYNPYTTAEQFNNICVHQKKMGVLRLVSKKIYFESIEAGHAFEISLSDILNCDIGSTDKGELIKICTKDNLEKGYVFRFSDFKEEELSTIPKNLSARFDKLNKKASRDKLKDLLDTRNTNENPEILKLCLEKKLPEEKQHEIINIVTNKSLLELFNQLQMKNVLKYEEYIKFIRKKYNLDYVKGLYLSQNFSLSRSDELFLLQPGSIAFEADKIRKKLVNSLVEYTPKVKDEKDAWKKFFETQLVNKTILSGGFKPLVFERTNDGFQTNKLVNNHTKNSLINPPITPPGNSYNNQNNLIGSFLNISYSHIHQLNFQNIHFRGQRLNDETDNSVISLQAATGQSYIQGLSNNNISNIVNQSLKDKLKEKESKIQSLIKDINSYSKTKISNFKTCLNYNMLNYSNNSTKTNQISSSNSIYNSPNKNKQINNMSNSNITNTGMEVEVDNSEKKNDFLNKKVEIIPYTVMLLKNNNLNNYSEYFRGLSNYSFIDELSYVQYTKINSISNQLKKLSNKLNIYRDFKKVEDLNALLNLKHCHHLFRDLVCIMLNLKSVKMNIEEKESKNVFINKVYRILKEKAKRYKDTIINYNKNIHGYINFVFHTVWRISSISNISLEGNPVANVQRNPVSNM